MNNNTAIGRRIAISAKWSALTEMVSRAIPPAILIILARILTPEDFGIVASAMIFISFCQIFCEAGLGKALIQTNESPEKSADIVFWSNLFLSVLVYGLIFIASPWLAEFFNSPGSKLVLRILGLQIIISSLTSVQQSLFLRNFKFKSLFWIRLLTALLPGFFSVPMAYLGYGVWALVTGSLLGSMTTMFMLWHKSSWRPGMHFELDLARKIYIFALWALGEGLAAWFFTWGDNLLVGKYLGVKDLGVYRVGWYISAIIFGTLLRPILPVMYSTFSRLQDDPAKMKQTYRKVNRIIASISLPIGAILFMIGPKAAFLVFGESWPGLGLVLSTIGLMHGVTWIININPEMYRAMGRPDLNTKLMIVAIFYYLPAYLIAAPFGLEVFTYTRLCVGILSVPIHVFLCIKVAGISLHSLWQDWKPTVIATLSMSIVISMLVPILPTGEGFYAGIVNLSILIVSGIAIYGGVMWLLDKLFILETLKTFRAAIFATSQLETLS